MDALRSLRVLFVVSAGICVGGCATLQGFSGRSYVADGLAREAGFTKEHIKVPGFELLTYKRFKKPSVNMRIYIEGDGKAWKTRRQLSDDPTPLNPIALGLAIADPSDDVAYIARPGQYPAPGSSGCDPTYWSQRRFAPEVIEALDKAIDLLKDGSGAKNIEITGYSGGGAIAVLVAARRSDVTALRTVAGNLDPKALCAYHKVSPLYGSMDPLDVAGKVSSLPQRHFIGSKDKTVPSSIAESFVKKEGDTKCESITIVDGATHKDGWRERWSELLSMSLRK